MFKVTENQIFSSCTVKNLKPATKTRVALVAVSFFLLGGGAASGQNKTADPNAGVENGAPTYEYDPDQAANPLITTYLVPYNTTPIQVSAGEKMIFRIEAHDGGDRKRPSGTTDWTSIPGVGPYQIKLYSSANASFDSTTGPTDKVISGSASGNVYVYVSSSWDGSPITITAYYQDLAPNPLPAPDTGTTKDADVTYHWTINPRAGAAPQSMHQTVPTTFNQWYNITASSAPIYTYHVDPVPPHYTSQTLLESFGNTTATFAMTDLTTSWRSAHSTLTTPDRVSQYLFSSSGNSTFVIDGNDQFQDQHQGFGPLDAFTPTALANGIGYVLPQTYSAANNAIGSYSIERRYQNGVISVRKTGP